MAIIVDKVQKRKDIALACRELFINNPIGNLTISQIAKEAGVGKGTLYEYFKNREEIVFELVNILMVEHSSRLFVSIAKEAPLREKVKKFAEFFYSDENFEPRTLYKNFMSITLVTPNKEIRDFQTLCFNNYYFWFVELVEQAIKNGEIIESALGLTKGMFVTAEGMFVASCTTNVFQNLERDLNEYIDNLFNIIEVK